MGEIELTALAGTNPLGVFAALGLLDTVDRLRPDSDPRLSWTDDIVPRAVLHVDLPLDEVIDLTDADRSYWRSSTLLTWGPDGKPLRDVKPTPADARRWLAAVLDGEGDQTEAELRLMAGLFAEGGLDNAGKTKPTHFHFTAGQQHFLEMVRGLADGVDDERLHEALMGPWRYDSRLKVMGWDAKGDRVYAVRATNPATDEKLGVPGADWLAFIGLSFFPVWVDKGHRLRTTCCAAEWKSSAFTWPLWSVPARPEVLRALLRDSTLLTESAERRKARGISELLRAPIRRTDQGGYGSFGAATPVVAGGTDVGRNPLLRTG